MFNKIRELWKQRKKVGQVLKYIKDNQAWVAVIVKAIKFAKDGYTRLEIAELVGDVLKIFNLRPSISYADDRVRIDFYMKAFIKRG